jgi:hypothetical protein
MRSIEEMQRSAMLVEKKIKLRVGDVPEVG